MLQLRDSNMHTYRFDPVNLRPATRKFYRRALTILTESTVPFLVCGSYALEAYTGAGRFTKDLDVFIRPADCDRALQVLSAAGYKTERVFPHWLAKAFSKTDFIDLIFSSGNGLCQVDDTWFENSMPGEILGIAVNLCGPEEIIWQQAFIMERERYDGADVAHLLRAAASQLNWNRMLTHFGPHWRVLLAHLILFGFIYPGQQQMIPKTVLRELLGRLQTEIQNPAHDQSLCQGTLLSRAQYLVDVKRWGYDDARLQPRGGLTTQDIQLWTDPVQNETNGTK